MTPAARAAAEDVARRLDVALLVGDVGRLGDEADEVDDRDNARAAHRAGERFRPQDIAGHELDAGVAGEGQRTGFFHVAHQQAHAPALAQ
ncbi:MAG: hypothetical protein WDO13_02715 [Verrucomicrobiota bacterium]